MQIKKVDNINIEEYKKSKLVRRQKTIKGGFDKIVFATDQDLDGFHIRGLLSGFIERYLYNYKDKIGMLQTPVIAITKNGKVQRWVYTLNDAVKLSKGETSDYKKGLGSWDVEDLKFIISKDGLDRMISNVDFMKSESIIDEWLGDDAEPRKCYILENNFSIASA